MIGIVYYMCIKVIQNTDKDIPRRITKIEALVGECVAVMAISWAAQVLPELVSPVTISEQLSLIDMRDSILKLALTCAVIRAWCMLT